MTPKMNSVGWNTFLVDITNGFSDMKFDVDLFTFNEA